MNNLPQDPEQVSNQIPFDDEIDLKELFFVLWNAKLFIIAITSFFAVLSVVIALLQPNIYESSAVLAPRNAQSSLSGLAAQYGGLAAMAGIQLPGGEEGSKTLIAMEKMKSKQFFEEYLYEAILVELMAAKRWDSSSNTLEIDADAYDRHKSKWIRDVDPPLKPEPSMQEAHLAFTEKHFSLSQAKDTGMVSITVEHISPYVAQKWVNLVINGISNSLRQTDVLEATKAITYLNELRENTNLVNMDVIFSQLIEEQTKTIMLANVSEDYVFQVLDPPYAAEKKSKPSRALICILGTLLGGMLAVLSALILHYALPEAEIKLQEAMQGLFSKVIKTGASR
jgi:hypothetical protein